MSNLRNTEIMVIYELTDELGQQIKMETLMTNILERLWMVDKVSELWSF